MGGRIDPNGPYHGIPGSRLVGRQVGCAHPADKVRLHGQRRFDVQVRATWQAIDQNDSFIDSGMGNKRFVAVRHPNLDHGVERRTGRMIPAHFQFAAVETPPGAQALGCGCQVWTYGVVVERLAAVGPHKQAKAKEDASNANTRHADIIYLTWNYTNSV